MDRLYFPGNDLFSVTSETYYEKELLLEVNEDIFTLSSRFVAVCEKYNNLNKTNERKMMVKRLMEAFFIWKIVEVVGTLRLNIERNEDRAFDLEHACSYLYFQLSECIDKQWRFHECGGCSKKAVVMDGNAKHYRTVCAAKPERVTKHGELNQFVTCSNSPLPGKLYCTSHDEERTTEEPPEREDFGALTRSKLKSLGLATEELKGSEDGCRKSSVILSR